MAKPSKSELRVLCATLALFLLLGSLPQTAGVVFASSSEGPALTLDFCHPLQSFVGASGVVMAPPAVSISEPQLVDRGRALDCPVPQILNLSFAPDPPPPKALV